MTRLPGAPNGQGASSQVGMLLACQIPDHYIVLVKMPMLKIFTLVIK